MGAMDLLGLRYEKQQYHPSLKKLRFDFLFYHNEKHYFVEFDGKQHQMESPYFHKTSTAFHEQRERDLVKNLIVRNTPNCVLIRINHTWIKNRQINKQPEIILNLSKYLSDCFLSKDNIIANSSIYNWINDYPSEDTLNKYFVFPDEIVDRENEELDNDEFDDEEQGEFKENEELDNDKFDTNLDEGLNNERTNNRELSNPK
jgi:hypothetical protein